MTPVPDPRSEIHVDTLRQELRALGYLDAGVDRFVLGPAQGTRRPLAIAALSALRIGVLAAALLGPAAALGITTRLPGLVTGTRDALVVALYLALLFGAAATACSFAAMVIVARLPLGGQTRRATVISRTAGTVVGAACLVYLTLWWRIANPDLASFAALWTLFALAIAVAISLLLGHATAVATFAVLVASRGATTPAVPAAPAGRLTAAAALVAFAGAAVLLFASAPEPPADAGRPELTVVSPGSRVKVFAIDGFDPAVAAALRDEGRIPTLTRLLSGGVVQLAVDELRDPARAWTTVATGQPPDVHGVEGLETRRVAGLQGAVASGSDHGIGRALRGATDLVRLTRPSTASGAELRSKTMWEVAADAGLRSAVVNWWATWPAGSAGANPPIVVSDRATLRLERGGSLDGEIAPASVYDRLRQEWPAIKQEAHALMTALLPASSDVETASALRRAAEVDAVQLALTARLDVAQLDLVAVYLPGLDIAQHALLGSSGTATPSTLTARLDGLRGYYVYLDALLRDVTVPAGNELVVLLTLPGRISSPAYGLLAVAGTGATAEHVTARARAIDVAPTLLHALGLPISRELSGAPVLGVFAGEFVKRYPVRQVDTYGRRTAPAVLRQGQPLDQEMIERLRSLGYVR
ncbi:MAG TPA: alkaline phosphatase family protein [Vicinamibacterales bacterium]|nr:alkaline phosphatase family protein [Vicinamibacterales bacterium]